MDINIQIFNNPQFGNVRIAMNEQGEPLFCLSDVCSVLGHTNPSIAKQMLDDEEWCKKSLGRDNQRIGNNEAIFVNESGLYTLILRSNLQTAKPFRKWVTSEVLPSIRKHGAYMTQGVLENIIQNPDFGIQLLNSLKEEQIKRAAAERQKYELERQNATLMPKATFYDTVLEPANECMDVGQAAKILKLSYGRNTLFKVLREKGIFLKIRMSQNKNILKGGILNYLKSRLHEIIIRLSL